jgi:CubicO group peptidase (beta-lactamase class C family)
MSVQGTCDPRFRRVRELFSSHFADGSSVGAAVCVCIENEPVVDLWAGFKDQERTQAWTADTIVNIYSACKAWSALCLHILAERGFVDYEKPIAIYWPEFAANGKDGILVRHALGHQTGLQTLRSPVYSLEQLTDWAHITTMVIFQKSSSAGDASERPAST